MTRQQNLRGFLSTNLHQRLYTKGCALGGKKKKITDGELKMQEEKVIKITMWVNFKSDKIVMLSYGD